MVHGTDYGARYIMSFSSNVDWFDLASEILKTFRVPVTAPYQIEKKNGQIQSFELIEAIIWPNGYRRDDDPYSHKEINALIDYIVKNQYSHVWDIEDSDPLFRQHPLEVKKQYDGKPGFVMTEEELKFLEDLKEKRELKYKMWTENYNQQHKIRTTRFEELLNDDAHPVAPYILTEKHKQIIAFIENYALQHNSSVISKKWTFATICY